jgi:hypothetical protein
MSDFFAGLIFIGVLVGICVLYAWIWHRAEEEYYKEKRRAQNEDDRP